LNKKIIKPKKSKTKHKEFVSIILLHDHVLRSKHKLPMGLIDINRNKKLLTHQIEIIEKQFQNFEIIISSNNCTKEMFDLLKRKHSKIKIRVVETPNKEEINSWETVRLCLNNIMNDKVMIIDGALFFKENIFKGLNFNKNFAILSPEDKSENLRVSANVGKNKSIEFFCFGASKSWTEIVFFRGEEALKDLRNVLNSCETKKKFFFEAINKIISRHKIYETIHRSKIIKLKMNSSGV